MSKQAKFIQTEDKIAVEAGGPLLFQSQPSPHRKTQARQGYTVRHSLKTKQAKKNEFSHM